MSQLVPTRANSWLTPVVQVPSLPFLQRRTHAQGRWPLLSMFTVIQARDRVKFILNAITRLALRVFTS